LSQKSCPPDLVWEKKQRVRQYIQKRTRDDPYFSVVTGSLHSGQITYDKQQPFVEKVMDVKKERGIHELLDETKVRKMLKGAQLWEGKSRQLVKSTQCYIEHCGVLGRDCLEKPKVREDLVSCMQAVQEKIRSDLDREHPDWKNIVHKKWKTKTGKIRTVSKLQSEVASSGFGQKSSDLVREYLGDDDAVAVDRHVGSYVCVNRGFCPVMKKGGKFKFTKEGEIPPNIYRQISQQIRDIAGGCSVKPAEVQVDAWLKGVCDARLDPKKKNLKPVFIGRGKFVDCRKRGDKL
jgi:endonuclease III